MYNNYHDVISDNGNFSTTDIGSAAALISNGIKLKSLDKTNPSRALFIFNDNINTRELLDKYWSGDLFIDAKAYFENLKWLKSRIYHG